MRACLHVPILAGPPLNCVGRCWVLLLLPAAKHGADNKNQPTEIICRFFLVGVGIRLLVPSLEACAAAGTNMPVASSQDAVEKKLYGWFWQW